MVIGVGMPHPVPSRSAREMNVNLTIIHLIYDSVLENVLFMFVLFDTLNTCIVLKNQ
jgi:hypothetical protein